MQNLPPTASAQGGSSNRRPQQAVTTQSTTTQSSVERSHFLAAPANNMQRINPQNSLRASAVTDHLSSRSLGPLKKRKIDPQPQPQVQAQIEIGQNSGNIHVNLPVDTEAYQAVIRVQNNSGNIHINPTSRFKTLLAVTAMAKYSETQPAMAAAPVALAFDIDSSEPAYNIPLTTIRQFATDANNIIIAFSSDIKGPESGIERFKNFSKQYLLECHQNPQYKSPPSLIQKNTRVEELLKEYLANYPDSRFFGMNSDEKKHSQFAQLTIKQDDGNHVIFQVLIKKLVAILSRQERGLSNEMAKK